MATTKEDRSFKQLINKRVTSVEKQFYEEVGDETLTVTAAQLWAEDVANNDPDTAVLDGVAEFREKLELTEDITVADQQSWFAEDGYRLKDWISDRFGSEYTLKLFDNNNNEIFTTDDLQWFWDYPTGILTISGDASAFTQPFKVDGYRYIGEKGLSGQGILVVSDQTERLALSPDVGDMVFQLDIETTYQWRTTDSSTPSWRVTKLQGIEDPFFGGGPAIYYYVDPAGDDENDGRASGSARAKQTIGAVFEELNDSGGVGRAHVQIILAPGTYSESSNLRLRVPVAQDVFIIPSFASYANNESITVSSDNGLITNSTTIKDLTTNAFVSFSDGERFAWQDDGYSLGGDILPTMLPMLKASTSPNLRIVTSSSVASSFNLSQYETTIDSTGIRSEHSDTTISIYGVELENSSNSTPTYTNAVLLGCKLINSGSGSTVDFKSNFDGVALVSGCRIDATADMIFEANSGQITIQSSDIEGTQLDLLTGKYSFANIVTDSAIRFGASEPTDADSTAGSIEAIDFTGTTDGLKVGGFANVRQLGDGYAPNFTGTLITVNENGRFTRQLGDFFAFNAGLIGPVISVSQMGQAINVSDYTGIVTSPAGNDVQVGSSPTISLSTLDSLGGLVDLDDFSRAT